MRRATGWRRASEGRVVAPPLVVVLLAKWLAKPMNLLRASPT